ncbi:hypothetical protein BDZ94DRAFT_1255875 [Collybia nuda]|uniref:Uncharacterized protein n=1 Tax=Collybia nuda TaxID=64659 RepID=A0A9P6CG77_9AGAR|nr:hypothetical protein BDZ94DRAFT_1255875 [Collybia nuda]
MPPRSLTEHYLFANIMTEYECSTPAQSVAENKTRKRLIQSFKRSDITLAIGSPLFARNHLLNRPLGKSERTPGHSGADERKVLFWNPKSKSEHVNSEVTAVPNPTPDAGLRPTQPQIPGYPPTIINQSGSHGPATLAHQSQSVVSPTFTPLPPLLSTDSSPMHISPSRTVSAFPSSFTGLGPTNAAAKTADQNRLHQPHKLSTPLIVLLAVGSSLLLAGLLILIKFCSRPVRRPRLIPSLPILDDPFADDHRFQTGLSKESPVFGGKERVSPRPGSNGPWTWTQYSPRKAQAIGKNSGDNPYEDGTVSYSPQLQGKMTYSSTSGKAQYHFTGLSHSTQSAPALDPEKPSVHQVQGNRGRAKRVSIASVSLYGASPRPSQISNATIGESNTRTVYTTDGHLVLERNSPRGIIDRCVEKPANEGVQAPIPQPKRYSRGIAYDGADVSSPAFLSYTIPQPDTAPSRGGRTRIKSSYYAPGAYPRVSELPSHGLSTDTCNFSGQPRERANIKSSSTRDLNPHTMASTTGFVSPVTEYTLPSPQPTLYPDDSLSVVDITRPTKASIKKAHSIRVRNQAYPDDSKATIATAQDASAALGSLMLLEFSGLEPQQKVGPKSVGSTAHSNLPRSNSGAIKRSEDKAPSIPLPPPLPSLTQMGLEHVNPQAYADYRSPTYSIYGLYESDRKSGFVQ